MEQFAHLRRGSVHRNLRQRQAIRRAAHHQLAAEGFGEFETPDLEPVIDVAERLVAAMAAAVDIELPAPPFPRTTVRQALRDHGTDRPDLRSHPDEPAILCLVDFPMAIRDDEDRITLNRHPMAQPHSVPRTPEDMLDIDTHSFDLVLNGIELASGGLRIHDAALQRRVLDLAAIDPTSFQELLHVLADCPPHGGFGIGLDRLCMQLLGTDSITDVAGFPHRHGANSGPASH